MASSSSSSVEQYPWPLINVGNFVSVKLSTSNYPLWQTQMFSFIDSLDSIGFIDGTLTAPAETDGTGTGQVEVTNEDHVRWRKTDRLIKGWILGSLTEEVLATVTVVAFNSTAAHVWKKLWHIFGQSTQIIPKLKVEEEQELLPEEEEQEPRAAVVGIGDRQVDLCNTLLAGNLVATLGLMDQIGLTAVLGTSSETALHVVIGTKKGNHIVNALVESMTAVELALRTIQGNTALNFAAMIGNTEAAKILVGKEATLLYIKNKDGVLPVHMAAQYAQKDKLNYLFDVTKNPMPQGNNSNSSRFKGQYIDRLFEGQSGVKLLVDVITSGFFDIALTIVKKYRHLAKLIPDKGDSPLTALVRFSSYAFPSGTRRYGLHRILSVRVIEQKRKIVHHQVLQLLQCLCSEIKTLNDLYLYRLHCEKPMLLAASLGIPEVKEEIVKTFPHLVWCSNEEDHYISHLAIKYRCETVFNLIYQMSGHKHTFSLLTDTSGNNMLHLAAKLAPPHKLNLVSGPALQMQRELQWFKEVEKFVISLFTKEHSKLMVDGEKWMKDTATTCIFTTALIATITFAAAITTPGGNDGASGFPVFHRRFGFTFFLVADAISFVTSTTSLMTFLSILTVRYAQEDFLYSLPMRLTFGLVTLFLSIISIMVAFGFILIVISNSKRLVLIPIFVSICLPIFSFLESHLSLLLDLISSTCCRRIFGKQSDKPFY